jgi:hypothetical protein
LQYGFAKVVYKRPFTFASLQTLIQAFANCKHYLAMKTHQYILEPYKGMRTRHTCPFCQQRDKTFALYIDTHTGEPLHPSVGRCNRESNCGYHYTPKQYFQDNPTGQNHSKPYKPLKFAPAPKPVSFIPDGKFKASLKAYEENYFIQYLISIFGMDTAGELIRKYFIGSSDFWKGATVFWQIDQQGKIRTGKIMLYSPTTGKRVKEPYNHINWVHKVIKQPDFNLNQCLFGEHLLRDYSKPVAIVESEKTAIIASVYLPQFIWLAFGGIGFSLDKCQSLKGRKVILFPDLKGFDKWNTKAKELSHLARFQISDLLERKATEAERYKGLDLADYLIKLSYQRLSNPSPSQSIPYIENAESPPKLIPVQPLSQSNEIAELESYFAGIPLPQTPVRLDACTIVSNVYHFVESHLTVLKANAGNKLFQPHFDRLQRLKTIL